MKRLAIALILAALMAILLLQAASADLGGIPAPRPPSPHIPAVPTLIAEDEGIVIVFCDRQCLEEFLARFPPHPR